MNENEAVLMIKAKAPDTQKKFICISVFFHIRCTFVSWVKLTARVSDPYDKKIHDTHLYAYANNLRNFELNVQSSMV